MPKILLEMVIFCPKFGCTVKYIDYSIRAYLQNISYALTALLATLSSDCSIRAYQYCSVCFIALTSIWEGLSTI